MQDYESKLDFRYHLSSGRDGVHCFSCLLELSGSLIERYSVTYSVTDSLPQEAVQHIMINQTRRISSLCDSSSNENAKLS